MSLNNSMMGLSSTAANAVQKSVNENVNLYMNKDCELVDIKIGCSGNGAEADYEIGDSFGNGEMTFDINEFGGNGVSEMAGNGSNPFAFDVDDIYEEVQNNFFMDIE